MRTMFVVVLAVGLMAASVATAQTCDDEVFIVTSEGAIEIHHNQTMFNCCCSVLSDVVQEEFLIDVLESEQLIAGGCDCLCCSDVETVIAGLEPGDYTLTLRKESEYGGQEEVGVWLVTVTGTSEPSVRTVYLPCVSTTVEDDETTWGVIKALYR